MLVKLDGALVSFRSLPCSECSQVATAAGLGVFLARVKPILARFHLPNHDGGSSVIELPHRADPVTHPTRCYAALPFCFPDFFAKRATFFRSSTNAIFCSCRAFSSGALKIEEGCTVATAKGASVDSSSCPRCRLTLKLFPNRACAAVATRGTKTRGFTA